MNEGDDNTNIQDISTPDVFRIMMFTTETTYTALHNHMRIVFEDMSS